MKVNMRGKDLKIITLKFSRDLFAQILMLSQNQQISLQHILTYPLTPVPLSMAHINGTMSATNKAALTHKLETQVTAVTHDRLLADAVLFDFMFMLRSSAKHLPIKYGDIARALLTKAIQYGAETIMFVCDLYSHDAEPSIKDTCRQDRGVVRGGREYSKISHMQKRPSDMATALLSLNFVIGLLNFLKNEWSSERCADLLIGHEFHFAFGPCYTYRVCTYICI